MEHRDHGGSVDRDQENRQLSPDGHRDQAMPKRSDADRRRTVAPERVDGDRGLSMARHGRSCDRSGASAHHGVAQSWGSAAGRAPTCCGPARRARLGSAHPSRRGAAGPGSTGRPHPRHTAVPRRAYACERRNRRHLELSSRISREHPDGYATPSSQVYRRWLQRRGCDAPGPSRREKCSSITPAEADDYRPTRR